GPRGRETADVGTADAVAGEPHVPDVSFGEHRRLRRAVSQPGRSPAHGRSAHGRRGVGAGRGVLCSRAANGGGIGAEWRQTVIVGVPKEIKTAEHSVVLVPAGAVLLECTGYAVHGGRGRGSG